MSNVTFRIDDNLKNESQQILDQLGLTMNTAFNIFLHQLCIDKGFPFRPSIDPFYSTANQTYLEKQNKCLYMCIFEFVHGSAVSIGTRGRCLIL